jgi:hypothetical protein
MGTTSARDLSGNNNTGWLIGGVRKVAGKLGQALKFDGRASAIGSYASLPDSNSFSFTDGVNDLPFSMGAWVNANAFDGDGGVNWIVTKDGYRDGSWNREVSLFTYNGGIALNIWKLSGSAKIGRVASAVLQRARWYYVVVTYDGSKTEAGIKIYVNGVQSDDTSGSSGTYTGMTNGDRKLFIGSWDYPGSPPTCDWNGSLDDVRIYNRALTAAEVSQLYRLGK